MTRRKNSKRRGSAREKFDQSKEVRAIARERVGTVKPSQAIIPKNIRKKPKHKKLLGEE